MRNLLRTCLLLVALQWVNTDTVTTNVTSLKIHDVCYGYLGCFSMASPWFSPLRPIPAPQAPKVIDTQFYLYTRAQPDAYQVTKLPTISLTGSDYVGTKPTFIVVQGFLSNSKQPAVLAIKDALLKEFDANVFIADWSKGSTQINYLQVVANGRVVGAEMIRFVKFLVSDEGAAVTRLHLIGHSIGAHISGYVGKDIPGIARITALDAAQPGFEGFPALVRVDSTDAVFVEAIHTNARPFIPTLGFGYMAPIGHVDFYVNGGFYQPGCLLPQIPSIAITSLADLGKVTIDVLRKWVFCHHIRAAHVFTASIANKGCIFWGHKVDILGLTKGMTTDKYLIPVSVNRSCKKHTCSPLGLQTTIYPARGVFLVKTTATDPYCRAETKNDDIMAPFKLQPSASI